MIFPVREYDLAATLTSGQAFRWRRSEAGWEGVVAGRWVRLASVEEGIAAEAVGAVEDWGWLRHYLQLDADMTAVLAAFPDDEPMRAAVRACRGLRLLRQEPWECLASFILSSTKQIVQIQQIVGHLCERFGGSVAAADGAEWRAFPTAERLAECTELELRECKMGFRAPYLRGAAEMVAAKEINLAGLREIGADAAREELLRLPGVGRKIADCVLLFAYGYQEAFPVDVWVAKALQSLYFPKRKARAKKLIEFSRTYFGSQAGYAQQYLFHYMRTQNTRGERGKEHGKAA